MSVTILLVMSIFGGLVGFYLGKGAATPQAISLREAAALMKEKGMMMEDTGKLMVRRTGDREMMEKGKLMMESGSVLSGKGTTMMGMMQDY
ncbi:hypothetical protein A3A63_04415 [Candidatus Gottesmanbacteria bacterium RIFCSPLOWO2_01_FULL_46_9]|uniref:Uncharacterized protein n=1 Tax=Candidatus Gottesmanbacteria bacterium RIFCSPLOWO2_01_FULL_46_9 TaxID=1798394 RepID=A0A1F6B0T4_9BACT|nr:MAG: hypothetical protein A3A63_04415 [Candidatus Gottesmanbacteria bacterium RIFCSPLOWO2_01_FULL_46_9]